MNKLEQLEISSTDLAISSFQKRCIIRMDRKYVMKKHESERDGKDGNLPIAFPLTP